MRIVFMGNPEFAVPSMLAIHRSDNEVVSVVTNPDLPVGRGRRLQSSPVAQKAAELNIPMIQPDSLKDTDFHRQLADLKADLFVVVAFKILPKAVLAIPRTGSINLHGSLLPRYRGAAPIQWALMNGDSVTGLTTFLIKPSVDTGDMLKQAEVGISADDDFGSLSEKMELIGARLLTQTLDEINSGKIKPLVQDESLVTKAPKITCETCQIDWNRPARELNNQIRGLSPFPGAFSSLQGKRLKIFISAVDGQGTESGASPGEITRVENDRFLVQTGEGSLVVIEGQLEGKRRMNMNDFLRGVKLEAGTVLG